MWQYVPNPLRCFKCQSFGHTQEHCMSQAICVSWGEEEHSPPCQSSPYYINCDDPHGSNFRDCPKFQIEREIQKIRATDKVSFPEAWHCYQAQHPVDFSQSFVSVLNSSNSTSSSSQTVQPTHHITLILSLDFYLLSLVQTAPVFLLGFSWKPLK